MPNHVHAIVVISACRDVACYVSMPTKTNAKEDVARYVSTNPPDKNEYMAERSPKQGSLAAVIRGLKSAVTKYANENTLDFSWQPRFHDHIIHNIPEMNRIADYIENNVTNWKDDEFYTP